AEAVIPAFHVTGVQTCALPISIERVDRRSSDVFTLGYSSPRMGSTSFGLVSARADDDTRIRLASLSHSRGLPGSLSMYLTLSRQIGRPLCREVHMTSQIPADVW